MTHKISNTGTYWNYIMAIVSLTIMLYLLGFAGVIAIYADQFLLSSKEQIPFYIELADEADEATIFSFQKTLENASYTKYKSVKYINNEEALDELKDDEILTEEDVLLFGENLLPNMIRFSIVEEHFADYPNIIQKIKHENFVQDVFFTNTPAESLAKKAYQVEIILLLLVIFFIFVSVTLIKNTLKLLLITNKESIQTMQTVGATQEYIAGPYLRQALMNGLLGSTIAVGLIGLSIYFLQDDLGLDALSMTFWLSTLGVGVLLIGILISWATTKHSMNKYLNKPVSQWLI